jgi:hypothetical protein
MPWHPSYRPTRFDGSPLYADEQFEDVPDIDAQRDRGHSPI